MARIPLLGTVGGTVVMAVALVAHLWMFSSHEHQPMSADHEVAGTAAAVADAPLPAPSCGMAACTAAPAEEPRLPSAVLLSPLPLVLVLRDRFTASHARPSSSSDDPVPPLSPVTSGVLLRE